MAWASKLKVITIFRTDSNCLKAGLTDPTSPIPKLLNCNCGPREMYPFVALADPDGRAAEAFGCNTSSLIRTFKMNCKSAPKMCKRLLTSSIVRKEAFFAAKVCSSQIATIDTFIFSYSHSQCHLSPLFQSMVLETCCQANSLLTRKESWLTLCVPRRVMSI